MSATGLYMNWTATGWTPAGGTLTPISEITDVKVGRGGTAKAHYADAAKFARGIAVVERKRKISVAGGDIAGLAAMVEGSVGTFTTTLNDLKNGAGTGALVVTLVNATVVSNPFGGKVNDFGSGMVELEGASVDGTTDPLTVVPAS